MSEQRTADPKNQFAMCHVTDDTFARCHLIAGHDGPHEYFRCARGPFIADGTRQFVEKAQSEQRTSKQRMLLDGATLLERSYWTKAELLDVRRLAKELRELSVAIEPRKPDSVTLNGFQARMILKFIDGDDDCSLEVADLPERTASNGEHMAAGLYVWLSDYPEEGCLLLTEEPTAEGFCAEPKPVETSSARKCEWGFDAGDDVWHTGCGEMWTLTCNDLHANGLKFCPCCGHEVDDLSRAAAKTSSPRARVHQNCPTCTCEEPT